MSTVITAAEWAVSDQRVDYEPFLTMVGVGNLTMSDPELVAVVDYGRKTITCWRPVPDCDRCGHKYSAHSRTGCGADVCHHDGGVEVDGPCGCRRYERS